MTEQRNPKLIRGVADLMTDPGGHVYQGENPSNVRVLLYSDGIGCTWCDAEGRRSSSSTMDEFAEWAHVYVGKAANVLDREPLRGTRRAVASIEGLEIT